MDCLSRRKSDFSGSQAMLESDAMASKRVKPKLKTAAAKKLAAAKRRAKGLDTEESSEEDYKPTKAAAKAKKLTPVKRKVEKLETLDDSDQDYKIAKPPAKKPAPAKKSVDGEVQDNEELKPAIATAKAVNGKAANGTAKAKPATTAKPKKKITLDSESEDDFKMEQSAADDS